MMKDVKFIVIHCSATPHKMDVTAKDIDRWHRQRGWMRIGYHKVIKRDGAVEDGRELTVAGAHAKGHNHHSIGICMVGGVTTANDPQPEDNFTEAQYDSLRGILFELQGDYPTAQIVGHNTLDPHKDCPCFDVDAFVQNTFL